MLTQDKAVQLAITVLETLYREDFYKIDNRLIIPTSVMDESTLFDIAGYFHPDSDNADTLYDYVCQTTAFPSGSAEADQVMFYVELFREDFYATKVTLFGDDRNMYITDRADSTVHNLSPNYLKWSREVRRHMYSLVVGGYYRYFVS